MDNQQITYAEQIMQERHDRIVAAIAVYAADRKRYMDMARTALYMPTRQMYVRKSRMYNRFVVQGRAAL